MEYKYCNFYKTLCCDINEELFYPVLGLLYRGIFFFGLNGPSLLLRTDDAPFTPKKKFHDITNPKLD